MEKMTVSDANSASVIRGSGANDTMNAIGIYHIECIGPDGEMKWKDTAPNVVVNQGKNGMLDTYFAGSAWTATWWMSLVTGGTATSASTYAVPIVTEIGTGIVTSGVRVATTWTAASAGSKSANTTTFVITGSATIAGNMLVTGTPAQASVVANVSATAGNILFSSGNFTGGSKTVSSGDTLNVTYSLSV